MPQIPRNVAWRMTRPFLWRRLLPLRVLRALLFLVTTGTAFGQQSGVEAQPEYRNLGPFGERIPGWIIAKLHLYFVAFIRGRVKTAVECPAQVGSSTEITPAEMTGTLEGMGRRLPFKNPSAVGQPKESG